MTGEPATDAARHRYPELRAAVNRHIAWARDFAVAGDLESAIDALKDAHAAAAETRATGAQPG